MEADSSKLAATVIKYFYFFCLDEQLSFAASLKVLSELKERNWQDHVHRAEWVRTLRKWKQKLTHVRPRAWSTPAQTGGMMLPMDLDAGVWASFLASGEATEVEAVLLSRMLGFSDQEISEGLRVTEGTVRYRVGRGLRHLGGYIES